MTRSSVQGKPLAQLLLKARPTPEQLADRLGPPVPDGLELFLAVEDLRYPSWLRLLTDSIAKRPRQPLQSGFALIVEGPLRSLDGSFFDLRRDSEANRELIERLVAAGREAGALAANIHLISPVDSVDDLDTPMESLRQVKPLLHYYVEACVAAGIQPLVENVPPVVRMREATFMFTPFGVSPEDLHTAARFEPELGFTLDLSHLQLYLNARRANAHECPPSMAPLIKRLQAQPGPSDLDECIDALASHLVNVHVSNASGLLGEGEPYDQGDADLDHAVARLLRLAKYIVTETLEPDPDRAVYMREAQARIEMVRSRLASGERSTNEKS